MVEVSKEVMRFQPEAMARVVTAGVADVQRQPDQVNMQALIPCVCLDITRVIFVVLFLFSCSSQSVLPASLVGAPTAHVAPSLTMNKTVDHAPTPALLQHPPILEVPAALLL